jgi:hypothetical protein
VLHDDFLESGVGLVSPDVVGEIPTLPGLLGGEPALPFILGGLGQEQPQSGFLASLKRAAPELSLILLGLNPELAPVVSLLRQVQQIRQGRRRTNANP